MCNRLLARDEPGGIGCKALEELTSTTFQHDPNNTEKDFFEFHEIITLSGFASVPMLPAACYALYAESICHPENAIDECIRISEGKEFLYPTLVQLESNETNETEFAVYMLPTPMPTKPRSSVTVTATITSAADAAPQDMRVLAEAMAKALEKGGTNVSADNIMAKVNYKITQEFTFAGVAPTREVATRAAAKTFNVREDMVEVVNQSRRLTDGRRLSGSRILVTIKVGDPEKADEINTQGNNTDAVANAFLQSYVTSYEEMEKISIPVQPTVDAKKPVMKMDISYTIMSPTTTAVTAPSQKNVKDAFEEKAAEGGAAAAGLSSIAQAASVETPSPTLAPTPLPAGQTAAPTSAPTWPPPPPPYARTFTMTTTLPTTSITTTLGTPDPSTPTPPTAPTAPASPTPPTPTSPISPTPPTPTSRPKASESGAPPLLRFSVSAVACAFAAACLQ